MENKQGIIDFIVKNSIEKVKCNICGSENREIISNNTHWNIPSTNVICKDCGLIYLYPRINEETYKVFYEKYYRKIWKGTSEGTPEEIIKNQILAGKKIVESLKKNHISVKNKRVLDYACSCGHCLMAFKEEGCSVFGIDYDKELIDFGRKKGLNLSVGGIDDIKGEFDIIVLSNIIEHLLNPKEDLKKIFSHLKTGGAVYLTQTGLHALKVYYNGLDSILFPEHPYTFTLTTFLNLISFLGLEPINSDESIFVIAKKTNKISPRVISDYKNIKNFLQKYGKPSIYNTLRIHSISIINLILGEKISRIIKNHLRKILFK